jgi:uncharacterized membrane protein YhhN
MRSLITLLFFICAGGFIASLALPPYTGRFAVKVLPIVLLLVAAIAAPAFRGKMLLLAAIVFSGAGDVILDLGFQGSFIAGLVSFLIAHLWYIGLFRLDISFGRIDWQPTLPAVIYPVAMAIFLWPYLGPLKIPVAVYVAVIATMMIFAINRQGGGRTVIFGALFFVVSDSLLALNKFYAPHPAAHYAIMTTYYLAQYLIVSGILKEKTSIK